MVPGFEADAKWFVTLAEIDAISAERVKAAGCAACGGPLDRADFDRKPRGDLGEAATAYARRTYPLLERAGFAGRLAESFFGG